AVRQPHGDRGRHTLVALCASAVGVEEYVSTRPVVEGHLPIVGRTGEIVRSEIGERPWRVNDWIGGAADVFVDCSILEPALNPVGAERHVVYHLTLIAEQDLIHPGIPEVRIDAV